MTHEKNSEYKLTGKAVLTKDGVDYFAEFTKLKKTERKNKNPSVKTDLLARIPRSVGTSNWNETILGNIHRIRPMKLYHKYRKKGIVLKRQLQILMKKYRVSREKSELLAKIANCTTSINSGFTSI